MRKFFAVTLALLLVIGFVWFPSTTVSGAEQNRYGYTLLSNDIQRSAYREILNCVTALTPEITLSTHATQSTWERVSQDVLTAVKMLGKDYPELYWFNGECGISAYGTENDVAITVKPKYVLGGESITAGSSKLATAKSQMQKRVASALSAIPANASDYEIALALHDYIIDHVVYAYEGDHQTAYGALVDGKAVCAGYARAYQLLMLEAGIPCYYVQGFSENPQTGTTENHAWNLVWLDGKCYYTDVTWDDQGSNGVFHEYLNLSKEEISKTHIPEESEVLPASCGHDNYRFFIKNTGKGVCDIRDHADDADVADCFQLRSLEGRNAVYYCTIHYHKDDFDGWFQDHFQNIANKLGFQHVQCELVELGFEHHVVLSGTLAEDTPTPTVTPTEPTQQPTQSIQQTQATQQTDPTQSTSATQPINQPTESSQQQQGQNPTQPTPTTAPTSASTEPIDPIEPTNPVSSEATIPSQEGTQTLPSQNETYASVDAQINPNPSVIVNDNYTDAEDENKILIVVVLAFVVTGAIVGVVAYFIARKRNS